MDRQEHLERCKQRAREYLDAGDTRNAVMSMMSGLKKHPETVGVARSTAPLGAMALMDGSQKAARDFIEGFN